MIPRFITQLLTGKKITLMEKGENIRSWLSVEDHCRAIDIILKKGEIGQTYCIGGREKTNLEVAKKILKIFGKNNSWIEFVWDRAVNDFRYAIDDRKIRKLGWKPKQHFNTSLTQTVKWYKENKWWWERLIKRT